jgi:hypothetical protein
VSTLFAIGAGVLEFLMSEVMGVTSDIADAPLAATTALAVWSFVYCAVPLAASGRTFGSAILACASSRAPRPDNWHAAARGGAWPASVCSGYPRVRPMIVARSTSRWA